MEKSIFQHGFMKLFSSSDGHLWIWPVTKRDKDGSLQLSASVCEDEGFISFSLVEAEQKARAGD